MITWNDLLLYIQDPHSITLYRKPDIHDKYLQMKSKMSPEMITSSLLKLLHFNKDSGPKYVIRKNDFPYDIEEEITHMVLWINPNYSRNRLNMEEISEVIQNASIKMGFNDYIFFENLPENRTVPKIKHFQVFYRKKRDV